MAKKTDLHSNFQGVIITPLVELIWLLTVELFFGGVFFNSEKSLNNSFSGVKVTPDIEEIKQPPKRSYPVPKIFTPLSELN